MLDEDVCESGSVNDGAGVDVLRGFDLQRAEETHGPGWLDD